MKVIDTLCIGGGGIFGLSYISIIEQLEINSILNLDNIKKYVGTSVGAVISFKLALGYSPKMLKDFCLEFDFKKIRLKPRITNLMENYGIDDGRKINEILKGFLYEKTNMQDITFKEFFAITGKSLKIICTKYEESSEVVFNEDDTPDMSVITAVRMSLSIPLIFTPVFYENCNYVDGGLTNNFGIELCDIEKTIGIIAKNDQMLLINSIPNYILGLVQILFKNSTKRFTPLVKNNNYIYEVEVSPTDAIDFDLDLESKNKIFKLGENSCSDKITKIIVNDVMENMLEIID